MNAEIEKYNASLPDGDIAICQSLYGILNTALPEAESKLWHGHPVWFLQGNPVVGYHKLKNGVQLLFWSGQSFDEPELVPEGSFKAAQIRYSSVTDIDADSVVRWVEKSKKIQWDYKNIVKRKGVLEKLSV
jgi:hypothetical protein